MCRVTGKQVDKWSHLQPSRSVTGMWAGRYPDISPEMHDFWSFFAQVRHARLFATNSARPCDDGALMALESVLGQALSRNKAHEKVDLWKEREIQDKGSRCTISLKSRKGDVVRQVTKVPEGAEVTSNVINQFEVDREANASKKEDVLLERLANGKDPAWRPDLFLSELKGVKGKGDLSYKLRPQDYLRMDAAFVQKVVAAYKAEKKADKKRKKKKKKKKEKKKRKEGQLDKKEKKEKKDKKEKKKVKKDKNKVELAPEPNH